MVNFLVATALAASTPAAAQSAAPPVEPALFAVSDSDTTIYIFGTFHALDGKSQWLDDTVRGAVERSSELVLETLVPEKPAEALVVPANFRPPSVTPSASFLATTRMAISAGQARGMQVGNGADMVLRHIAEAEGKKVEGLETLQLQIDMFNRMPSTPPSAQARPSTIPTSYQLNDLSKAMVEMQTAWKRGDQGVFVRMLNQLKASSPDTYRMMFTERNTRWADWIRARMQSPGTVFVAVGAGHLAGCDSLLVKLAERGLVSRRIY